MRVQTEEWRRFIPGIRMYKGKKTLFYNGEILWQWTGKFVEVYNKEERQTWEVIIILPGVEVIPYEIWGTFKYCENVKTVIMSDSVRRIEKEIDEMAFTYCEKLIIVHIPQNTQLGRNVIRKTALMQASPFKTNRWGDYEETEEVNNWIKTINGDTEEYALHRACSSYNPIVDIIHGIVKRKGLKALYKKNEIGITPLEYLQENPFNDMSQSAVMKRYVLDMMGEIA